MCRGFGCLVMHIGPGFVRAIGRVWRIALSSKSMSPVCTCVRLSHAIACYRHAHYTIASRSPRRRRASSGLAAGANGVSSLHLSLGYLPFDASLQNSQQNSQPLNLPSKTTTTTTATLEPPRRSAVQLLTMCKTRHPYRHVGAFAVPQVQSDCEQDGVVCQMRGPYARRSERYLLVPWYFARAYQRHARLARGATPV